MADAAHRENQKTRILRGWIKVKKNANIGLNIMSQRAIVYFQPSMYVVI